MKPILVKSFFALAFSFSTAVFSQDTIQIIIDPSYCDGISQLKGEFGIYETIYDRYGQRKDTLIKPLSFKSRQEIVLNNAITKANYKLQYTPSDTLVQQMDVPFYDLDLKNNTIHIDCYFFRKRISFLAQMKHNDTLYITSEYRGDSHTGMVFPRSTLRILKKNNQFYYARNNLPTRGDLVNLTFPDGKYENGFSEDSELTREQMTAVMKFEQEIVNSVAYSVENGSSEIRITWNGKTYKFIIDERRRNDEAHLIWELLK